jgi:hypothetical protein
MIVIVIIGVVYTLAVTKLQSVGSQENKVPTLKNLKTYLSALNTEHASIRFLCLDDCSECSVYEDGIKTKSFEKFFDAPVERYRYDFLQGAVALRDEIYFSAEGREENVCFSLTLDAEGVSDQEIVVYKEKAYDFSSYFTPTKVYDSLEELVNEKEKKTQEVMQ